MSDVVDGLIEKRVFLKSLGAVFLSSFLPSKAIASVQSPTGRKAMLASAFMTKDRKFGLALLDDKGELVTLISLPARGHDLTVHRPTGTGVLFARRPGTFALAISQEKTLAVPMISMTAADREAVFRIRPGSALSFRSR